MHNGKKHKNADTMAFDPNPCPNHKRIIGAMATTGIAFDPTTYGRIVLATVFDWAMIR
jgi:hypothetical protein